MSEIETALALRLEASLAKFERQMSRATQVGAESAERIQGRFKRMGQQVAKSAEDSGNVMVRELDRLRTRFDPLFAASQRYERELNEMNTALKVGAISAAQHEAALERLNAEYAQSAVVANSAGGAMVAQGVAARGLSSALGRAAPGIQQASYQVQDFAVQVAMGTDVSRAFAQQAPQLLGAVAPMGSKFAALGGVLGVLIAIGVPLIAMMRDTGEETKTLDDRLEDLKSAVDDYRSAARDALLPTADLAERYGAATGAAREFLSALEAVNRFSALEALRATMAEIATQFGALDDSLEALEGGEGETVATMRAMVDALGASAAEAQTLLFRMLAVRRAATPEEAATAASALLATLEQALGPYDQMNASAQELYRNTRDAGERAAAMVGAAGAAGSAIGGAASQASRLADEMTRAVGAALDLAAAGVTDVRRAQIEYDFRDDPVGRAAAMAGADFDARSGSARGVDPTMTALLERQRREVVANATEVARLTEETNRWREANSRSAQGGSGGDSGGGGDESLFALSDAQIASMEAQLEMIGRTAAETAELTTRQTLLNEARRRGLDLNQRSAETGETLTEQIDRQAAAVGRLVAAQEQANSRAEFFADIQGDLRDGLLDAIVAGEDFSGTLQNVARALARAALEAALFRTGPLAGLFGGGGGGGFLSRLFGAGAGGVAAKILHAGGTVGAGVSSRLVAPGLFASAPRMHQGGIAGLAPGEVPAILQTGERVLPRGALMGGGGAMRVSLGFDATMGQFTAAIRDETGQIVAQGMSEMASALPSQIKAYTLDPRRNA